MQHNRAVHNIVSITLPTDEHTFNIVTAQSNKVVKIENTEFSSSLCSFWLSNKQHGEDIFLIFNNFSMC